MERLANIPFSVMVTLVIVSPIYATAVQASSLQVVGSALSWCNLLVTTLRSEIWDSEIPAFVQVCCAVVPTTHSFLVPWSPCRGTLRLSPVEARLNVDLWQRALSMSILGSTRPTVMLMVIIIPVDVSTLRLYVSGCDYTNRLDHPCPSNVHKKKDRRFKRCNSNRPESPDL